MNEIGWKLQQMKTDLCEVQSITKWLILNAVVDEKFKTMLSSTVDGDSV